MSLIDPALLKGILIKKQPPNLNSYQDCSLHHKTMSSEPNHTGISGSHDQLCDNNQNITKVKPIELHSVRPKPPKTETKNTNETEWS